MRLHGHRALIFVVASLFVLVGAALSLSPVPVSNHSTRVGEVRPNVLIILTDDQRTRGTLGSMPAVERWFGKGGTKFTNAFATTPLCCPSRASLLTGMYAHNHGVHTNREPLGALADVEQFTVQRMLEGNGYMTGIYGKYFNHWPNDRDPAWFDRWAVTPRVTYGSAEWNVQGSNQVVDDYPTNYIRDDALTFLDQAEADDERPWFLYVAPMTPHMPATPESRFAHAAVPRMEISAAMHERDRRDKPPYIRAGELRTPEQIRHRRRKQLRALLSVDVLVDSIMKRLAALGELRGTLAIFASDNGVSWGEHGLFGKTTPYMESVHVPLFARWPAQLPAHAKDHRLVGLLDLVPTILDATQIAQIHPMDGIDLLDPTVKRKALLLESWPVRGSPTPRWTGLLFNQAEYVVYPDEQGVPIFREFYDLRRDPQQLTNVLQDGVSSNDPNVSRLDAWLAMMNACKGPACA
jgi:arylsulfatase A-like enzyme